MPGSAPGATISREADLDLDDPSGPTFEALGVAADLAEALADVGIERPFPIQERTIPDAIAGHDICGKAQTGSGKTLAFGLPLIERTTTARRRRPHSLILAPTRELANQIAEELTPLAAARGLWLTTIYGGVSASRQVRALNAGVDIVIATPGRLNDLLEQGELSVSSVSFLVLDEADQMADMGFLPQVERILKQIEGHPQTLLFSATLDGAVGTLVRRYQRDPRRHEVESTTPTVEQLEQRFIGVQGGREARRRLRDLRRSESSHRLRPHDASRRPGRQAAQADGAARCRHPRASLAEPPRLDAGGVPQRRGAGTCGDQRCRPRTARRRHRRRDPLRSARGLQDVHPPLRPHRARR